MVKFGLESVRASMDDRFWSYMGQGWSCGKRLCLQRVNDQGRGTVWGIECSGNGIKWQGSIWQGLGLFKIFSQVKVKTNLGW